MAGHRNGYRDRDWHTRSGTVPLRIPKLRRGSYFPAFLEPRRSAEKALAGVGDVFVGQSAVEGLELHLVRERTLAFGQRRAFVVNARRSAREYDAARRKSAGRVGREIERMYLAVDSRFSDPTRDELSVLAAEIQDEDHAARVNPFGSSAAPWS